MENNSHNFCIDNLSRVNATGVLEVTSFNANEIRLKLKNGNVLSFTGSELKITCFDNQNGNFTAVGKFDGAKYKNSSSNFLKKAFK